MNIILCGSVGKCGSEVKKALIDNDFKIVAEVNKNTKPLRKWLQEIKDVNLIIDFTVKEVAYQHILLCIQYNIPFICGTTNFSEEEIELIKSLCNKQNLKGIICYNFSLPINLIIKEFKYLTSLFDDVLIEETHHKSKIDRPSGTAKLLKEQAGKPVNIISHASEDYIIEYKITFKNKYDKMLLHYQVFSKMVYANGIIDYLINKDENKFDNLLK